jgi:hypothetical protein
MITAIVREHGFSIRLAKSKLREINKSMGEEVGEYWRKHFLPKHFTPAGAREYGYTPRNVAYMIQKAKKWGHRNPLEWSGESKRQALMLGDVRTTGTTSAKTRVRVVLHTPKLNFIPKGGTINMRDEITRVTQAEADKLAQVATDSVERQMRALNDTGTRRIA